MTSRTTPPQRIVQAVPCCTAGLADHLGTDVRALRAACVTPTAPESVLTATGGVSCAWEQSWSLTTT